MVRRRLATEDSSQHAAKQLSAALRRAPTAASTVPQETVAEALTGTRVAQHDSKRDVVRMLFISTNTELLNPTVTALNRYLDVSTVFAEVHVLVLRPGIAPRRPVLRPHPNVFVYTAAAKSRWWLPFAGWSMITSQLVFATGFRPDLIVARDPYESAALALYTARQFDRPAQLHVLDDLSRPPATVRWWQRWLAWGTTKRFDSIRTTTKRSLQYLADHTDCPDLALLPQYHPGSQESASGEVVDLRSQYPQYVWTMLCIDPLETSAAAFRALDAASYQLRSGRVALLIIGDGPARAECERRADILGVRKQVIFLSTVPDVAAYIAATDLLLVMGADEAGDQWALEAAAVGTAVLAVQTDTRSDWFTHRESAYLCNIADAQQQAMGVGEILTDAELRQQLTEQAKATIDQHFTRDLAQYRALYRASVEAALFAAEHPAIPEVADPAAPNQST